jgi:hypothetical protein
MRHVFAQVLFDAPAHNLAKPIQIPFNSLHKEISPLLTRAYGSCCLLHTPAATTGARPPFQVQLFFLACVRMGVFWYGA